MPDIYSVSFIDEHFNHCYNTYQPFCPLLTTVQAIFWTNFEITIFISVVTFLIKLPRMSFTNLLWELDLVYIFRYSESTFIIISAASCRTKFDWEIMHFWKFIFCEVYCNNDLLALAKINWSEWTSLSSCSWSWHDCRSTDNVKADLLNMFKCRSQFHL